MLLPDYDELYEVDQTYLGPPRRYRGPDAAQGDLRVARHRTLDVRRHPQARPAVHGPDGRAAAALYLEIVKRGRASGIEGLLRVQCCVDVTMPVAWLMTDRLDRALRRSRCRPLPRIPQGPGVRYVLAMLRPRGSAGGVGHVAAAVRPRREEC